MAAGIDKPIVACFMGAHGVVGGRESLRQHGIPSFAFPEDGVRALARVVDYAAWRALPEASTPELPDLDRERARRLVEPYLEAGDERWLPPQVCVELLECYGIESAESQQADDAAGAAAAAAALGFPVAVKLISEDLQHKSDVGGVRLGLNDEAAVRDAVFAIEGELRSLGRESAMDGVLVQRMVPDGVEVILGTSNDPAMGPLLMFGLGGTYVELLEDVAFRLHPVTARDAHDMVRSIRTFALLEGYRNSPPADVDAIEDTILRLSQLLSDVPEISEMDINPLKVRRPGRGAVAVDARIRVVGSG